MKIIFFGLAMVLCCKAIAQEFGKVKVGFTLGYLNRTKPIAASFEGNYRINNKMLIGYRAEYAFTTDNSIKSKGLYYQIYLPGFVNRFRPFVSLGVSQFTPSTDMAGGCGVPQNNRNANIENKLGGFSRVGFDFGHLSLMVDANLAAKSKSIVESNLSPGDAGYHTPYVQYLNNSYATFKLGFWFGGGKRKAKAVTAN